MPALNEGANGRLAGQPVMLKPGEETEAGSVPVMAWPAGVVPPSSTGSAARSR